MLRRSVAAVLLASFAGPVRAQDASLDARLTKVEGQVYLFYQDAPEEAVLAETDCPVEPGDRVRTASDGRAEIGLEDGGVVELGPDSDFALESLERQAPSFSLAFGALVAKLQSLLGPGGRLTVKTPTAVAAVRGTEFAVEHSEDEGETRVGVFDEGRVAVTSEGGETVLEAEQETSVRQGAPPSAAARLQRLRKHRARMRQVRGRVAWLRGRFRRLPSAERLRLRADARARFRAKSPEERERVRRRAELLQERRRKRLERFQKRQERRREDGPGRRPRPKRGPRERRGGPR